MLDSYDTTCATRAVRPCSGARLENAAIKAV